LVRRFYRDVWNRWDDQAVDQVLADDFCFRLRCSGSHEGELLATAPTGRFLVYEAAAFLRSRDNQLCEAWVLGDLDGLRAQLRD
jgi:predicted ester cyclase